MDAHANVQFLFVSIGATPKSRARIGEAASCDASDLRLCVGHEWPALLGADDLEVLVDEDVVRPVDTDHVDLVLAVAQLHDAVDDAPG